MKNYIFSRYIYLQNVMFLVPVLDCRTSLKDNSPYLEFGEKRVQIRNMKNSSYRRSFKKLFCQKNSSAFTGHESIQKKI
ncbi:unnamed protein product, partial [Larinioides sclopetarius]